MQSKSKIVGALIVFALGGFLLSANAQNVMSVYNPYDSSNSLDYRMGVIYINGSGSTVVPTNVVPGTTVGNSSCVPYLSTYHKFGELSGDVAKLQLFLNEYNGANLNGLGYYGPATQQEVKNFQYAYGINPTGAQYEKTTMLINSLKCGTTVAKARVVYTGSTGGGYVSTASNGGTVYPNPSVTTTPTRTTATKSATINPTLTGKPGTATITATTSTSTFMNSFKDDFQKMKDNYKAYVLVLVLVLALFWFLRKAATE